MAGHVVVRGQGAARTEGIALKALSVRILSQVSEREVPACKEAIFKGRRVRHVAEKPVERVTRKRGQFAGR